MNTNRSSDNDLALILYPRTINDSDNIGRRVVASLNSYLII